MKTLAGALLLGLVCWSASAQVIIVNDDDGPPGFVAVGTWSQSATSGYVGTYKFTLATDPPS